MSTATATKVEQAVDKESSLDNEELLLSRLELNEEDPAFTADVPVSTMDDEQILFSQLVLTGPEPIEDLDIPAVSNMKKSVSFNCLHIREYPVILGDHPSTSSGLPVTLDWNSIHSYDIPVDQYEQDAVRRAGVQLRMPPQVRQELIQDTDGASTDYNNNSSDNSQPEEFRQVTKNLQKIKHQRAQTIAMQDFEGIQVFCESAARKWKRWKSKGISDPEPAAVWLKQWQQEKKEKRNTETTGPIRKRISSVDTMNRLETVQALESERSPSSDPESSNIERAATTAASPQPIIDQPVESPLEFNADAGVVLEPCCCVVGSEDIQGDPK
jgi:hypothetical protein